jgi:MtfA peptidase
MFSWLKNKRRERALAAHAIPDSEWTQALNELPFLNHYDAALINRLRELSTLFLVEKSIVTGASDGEHALVVTPHMRIVIAAQACLMIVGRGESVTEAMNDYDGWENVVVYPGDFPQTQDVEDEYGVVHRFGETIAGESWEGGPVLLSWPAVAAGYEATGMALVVHEFAHKIDMLNGEVDGIPPLPPARRAPFKAIIESAYQRFCARAAAGEETAIDPYAAEQIDEFFAVTCEVFFAEPELLRDEYPAYYNELLNFFRVDPVIGKHVPLVANGIGDT